MRRALRAPWRRWPPTKGHKKEAALKGGCLGPDLDCGGGRAPFTPKAATPKAVTPPPISAAAMTVVVKDAPAAKGGKRGGFRGKAATKVAAPTTPKLSAAMAVVVEESPFFKKKEFPANSVD